MRVAIIQMKSISGDKAANFRLAEQLLQQAAGGGACFAVLPELWSTGFDLAQAVVCGESLQGETVAFLRHMAQSLSLEIGGGSFVEEKQGKYYNTSLAIGANGQIITKYRKVHLFSYDMAEDQYLSAGDQWVGYDSPVAALPVAMMICYDLRFPEFARNLALRGNRIFTVPACWPAIRIEEYRLFCRSRAAENRCFLLSANQCGDIYGGHSLIVSPFGQILAEADKENQVLMADLDFNLFADPRLFSSFRDRRKLLDEIDDGLL